MPTIEVQRSDLELLLGEQLTEDSLSSLLMLVKGELKAWPEESGSEPLKIELNDTNRPDLWSPEGIARQIRAHIHGSVTRYPFFNAKAKQKIYVSEAMQTVRPYLAGFIVRGLTVTSSLLTQLIASQEKLAEIFGQKRRTVSIGLYPLSKIVFPIQYDLANPDTACFIPLGFDHPMSLREILEKHPKGITYGDLLKGQPLLPLLSDAHGRILSFPPIINSRETGEVVLGDTDLLVEVTGSSLRMVILAANIFACNLFDRLCLGDFNHPRKKSAIEPIEVVFAYETDWGRSVKTPYDFSQPVEMNAHAFEKVLGEPISWADAEAVLTAYGYTVTGRGQKRLISSPPYRDDLMHSVDIVEDFAISRGFHTFVPALPSVATIGSQSAASSLTHQLADAMVGFGFEEVLSNVLLSYTEQVDKMRIGSVTDRPERRVVMLENPMTDRHAEPRSWLLPLLLRVEAASSKTYYSHRFFEIGEVVRMTESPTGCETALHVAALWADAGARFSDLHAVLFALLEAFSLLVRIVPMNHPTFIDGRAGRVMREDRELGLIGEIHPEVLTMWGIGTPAVAFELDTAVL